MEADILAQAHEIDFSLWGLFARATIVVKLVMIMLIVASFWAWGIIVQKIILYRKARSEAADFDRAFWSGEPLDGLFENKSDIQPDTIHGDTQAQSATVFALSYLLGIKLMPRIRGLQNLTFYKPSGNSRLKHLDILFDQVAPWKMIETYLPDMLRVALSVKTGKIQASFKNGIRQIMFKILIPRCWLSTEKKTFAFLILRGYSSTRRSSLKEWNQSC